ncbi:hypothetical protein D1872_89830 [compost metagenome]
MGFFKVNHNEASNFEPIPPGTYEAYISGVESKTFSSGSRGLALTLTIRDDVDQEAKKRKVFDNLVSSEKAMFRWQDYAKATSLPDGAEFNSEDELIKGFGKHLKGKAVKITIRHDDSRDNFKERIAGVAPSGVGGQVPGSNPFDVSSGQAAGAGADSLPWEDDGKPINISDDELPF